MIVPAGSVDDFGRLQEHDDGGDEDDQIGEDADNVINGAVEHNEQRNADGKGDLQRAVIVLEAEHGPGVLQVGDDGEIADQTEVVACDAKHNAENKERYLQRFAFDLFDGGEISENTDNVLHRAAVPLQNDGAGAINQLAQTLDEKNAFGGFAGGTDGIGHHSQQAADIADDNVDGIHIDLFWCVGIDNADQKGGKDGEEKQNAVFRGKSLFRFDRMV